MVRIHRINVIHMSPHRSFYSDRVTHPLSNDVKFVRIHADYLVICIESHSYVCCRQHYSMNNRLLLLVEPSGYGVGTNSDVVASGNVQ